VLRLPQGKRFKATVIDVVGSRCAVRLAQNGQVLRGIPYSGGDVAVGSQVNVDYTSGSPAALVVAEGYTAPASRSPIRQRGVESDAPPSNIGFVDEHEHVEADITDLAHIADLHCHIEGALAAYTGVGSKFVAARDGTIEKAVIYVETTGSAGNTVVDVNINGASIYGVSTKPTVAYDDVDGIDSRVPDTVDLSAGDLVVFDIDSAATGAAGLDIVVVIDEP